MPVQLNYETVQAVIYKVSQNALAKLDQRIQETKWGRRRIRYTLACKWIFHGQKSNGMGHDYFQSYFFGTF